MRLADSGVGLLLHKTNSDPHKTSQSTQISVVRPKFYAEPGGIVVAVTILLRKRH